MLPVVMRNDPSLKARPLLLRQMEEWWAGALWDPRPERLAGTGIDSRYDK